MELKQPNDFIICNLGVHKPITDYFIFNYILYT